MIQTKVCICVIISNHYDFLFVNHAEAFLMKVPSPVYGDYISFDYMLTFGKKEHEPKSEVIFLNKFLTVT